MLNILHVMILMEGKIISDSIKLLWIRGHIYAHGSNGGIPFSEHL